MSGIFGFGPPGGDMDRYSPPPYRRIGPYRCYLSEPSDVSIITHTIVEIFFPVSPDTDLDALVEVKFVPLLREETFHSVQQRICMMKELPFGSFDLVQMPGDRDVSVHDTLRSLNYRYTNYFLAYKCPSHRFATAGVKGSGNIRVTCKCPSDRKILHHRMLPHQPMDILMKFCSHDLRCPVTELRFKFKHKFIQPHHTCLGLGIVDGNTVMVIRVVDGIFLPVTSEGKVQYGSDDDDQDNSNSSSRKAQRERLMQLLGNYDQLGHQDQ